MLLPLVSYGQSYRVYDTRRGEEINIAELVERCGDVDVLFFGEQHNDSIAHLLQDTIYAELLTAYDDVALSLEMFETDVQLVLDEYLSGYITESKLTADARPWNNYKQAYRPLVERAKAAEQAVIAANAPRRYVNMVSREGLASLEALPKTSRAYLPPLPIETDDPGYYARFQEIMGGAGHTVSDNFYFAQSLWDASMAYRIYRHWKKNKRSKIFHLNGSFHTDYRQGTITQLLRYNKKIEVRNISCLPVDNLSTPIWQDHAELGDFVILTKG